MNIGFSNLSAFAKKLAPHADGGGGKLPSMILDTKELVAAEMGTSSSLKTVSLGHKSIVGLMFEEPRTRGEATTLGAMPVFRPQNEQFHTPSLPPMSVDHGKARHMSHSLIEHDHSRFMKTVGEEVPTNKAIGNTESVTYTPQGHAIHKKAPEAPAQLAKVVSEESEEIQNLISRREKYVSLKSGATERKNELEHQLRMFQEKHFSVTEGMDRFNVPHSRKGHIEQINLHGGQQEVRRISPNEFEKYLNDLEKDLKKHVAKKQKQMSSTEAHLSQLNNEVNALAEQPAELVSADAGRVTYVKPELAKEADLTMQILDGYSGLRKEEASLTKETAELIVPKLTHPFITEMRERLKAYRELEKVHCHNIYNDIDVEHQLIKWCEKHIKAVNSKIETLEAKFNHDWQVQS